MKKSVLLLGIVSLLTSFVFAQSEQKESIFSVETGLLWPFLVQATRTHFTVKLWQKGNLQSDVYAGGKHRFPKRS